jgi:hypoxanthine phosphoribosyltransferase
MVKVLLTRKRTNQKSKQIVRGKNMGRNKIHCLQSQIFRLFGPFNFLNFQKTDNLVECLIEEIDKSQYHPDVIVGISRGGDYPANSVGKKLGIETKTMQVNHYSIHVGRREIDEIIGVYRLAKAFGYKPLVSVVRRAPCESVRNKKVLLVDEDACSGRTIEVARQSLIEDSPSMIRTAVLHTVEGNDSIDFSGNWNPKENHNGPRWIFPWSKISPYYEESEQVNSAR